MEKNRTQLQQRRHVPNQDDNPNVTRAIRALKRSPGRPLGFKLIRSRSQTQRQNRPAIGGLSHSRAKENDERRGKVVSPSRGRSPAMPPPVGCRVKKREEMNRREKSRRKVNPPGARVEEYGQMSQERLIDQLLPEHASAHWGDHNRRYRRMKWPKIR